MPQLDIYTFPTQITILGLVLFLSFLWVTKFLLTAFFKIELLEKEEIYTSDTLFLVRAGRYTGSGIGRTSASVLTLFATYGNIR